MKSVVRLAIPLTDLRLCVMDIRDLDARQRFRLGVGLAKLGLFDLSLKHVWMVIKNAKSSTTHVLLSMCVGGDDKTVDMYVCSIV